MRPAFWTFLCLLPLALGAATLSLLGRTDLAPLTDPELLKALDPSGEEELWRAQRRGEDKRQVTCALLDGRLTLRQAAARFRDIDDGLPAKARGRAAAGVHRGRVGLPPGHLPRRFRVQDQAAEPCAGGAMGRPTGG
jgi:hypothetical protein